MRPLRRQPPSSPPLTGAEAVVLEVETAVFVWTLVGWDAGARTATFQLNEYEYVFDQPPIITPAECVEHASNDAGNDGGFRRGAVFNRATEWTMSEAGVLVIKFGAVPAIGDHVYFQQALAQAFPVKKGTVPPIWALLS